MFEVSATAVRIDKTIQVTMHGFLRDSSQGASITGIYPGSIVHDVDPGYAEVHVREYQIPGSPVPSRSPMPWRTTVEIIDPKHHDVAIFVNNQEVRHVAVTSMPLQFEVYALAGSDHWGSVILPVGHTMGRLFHRVFGPSSHEVCVQWVSEHANLDFDF